MAKLKRDSILGLVFFAGLLILLYATAKLSSFSLGHKESIEVNFPDARGLKVGDNVFVLGTQFGWVTAVDYDPAGGENPVRVELELRGPVVLRAGFTIRIVDSSLLGGKMVSIEPGKLDQPLVDRSTTKLIGQAPRNPVEALGEMFGGEGNRANLGRILDGLAQIIDDARQGKGSLGKLLQDPALYEEARQTFTEVKGAVQDARAGKGSLGKLLAETKLYDDLTSLLQKANEVVDSISKGDGVVAKLLNDKQMAQNVDQAIANFRTISDDLVAGRGTAGKILRDPKTAEAFDEIVQGVNRSVKAINASDGVLGEAIHGKETRDQFKSIVADVSDVAKNLREGKGTMGKLFSDPALYDEVMKVVRQISRTLEDAREAAPVSTFVTIFTGVFQ